MVFGLQEHGCPTKTGLYDDCILLDSAGREDLAIVLKFLYKKTSRPNGSLFPGLTLARYAEAIDCACDALDLRFLQDASYSKTLRPIDRLLCQNKIIARSPAAWQMASIFFSEYRYRKPEYPLQFGKQQ